MIQPLWRPAWKFLKKLKTELPCDPAMSLLGIYREKSIVPKDTCIPGITAVPLTITKAWKQPKCLLKDECRKKICCMYTVEYDSVLKRSKTRSFVDMWMDLASIIRVK